MKILLQIASLFILLSFYSCKEDENIATPEETEFTYPLEVGNNWQYEQVLFDSEGKVIDLGEKTRIHTVGNSTKILGEEVHEFLSESYNKGSLEFKDNGFIMKNRDGIYFYEPEFFERVQKTFPAFNSQFMRQFDFESPFWTILDYKEEDLDNDYIIDVEFTSKFIEDTEIEMNGKKHDAKVFRAFEKYKFVDASESTSYEQVVEYTLADNIGVFSWEVITDENEDSWGYILESYEIK